MTAIEWIGGVPARNYTRGRMGREISGIVDHWVGAGTAEQAIRHFQRTDLLGPVSAHFVLSGRGRIFQLLPIAETAYHAGHIETNLTTVGIEHEATPMIEPTPELYAASAWLHRHLADTLGIELAVGRTVRPHRDIVPTQCPGTVDLARIVAEAADHGGDMDEATVRRIVEDVLAPYRADVRATLEAIKAAEEVIRVDNRNTAEAIKKVLHDHLEHGHG